MNVKICKLEKIKLVTTEKELIVGKETINPILPVYGKSNDACMDIYPIYMEQDDKKDRLIYHTGLVFQLPIGAAPNYANGKIEQTATEMEIRPRSNLTKSNWYIPNAPGTLDFGYRGELLVIFKNRTDIRIIHLFKSISNVINLSIKAIDEISSLREDVLTPPYKCDGKDRCAQIIIRARHEIVWEEVLFEELTNSDRGTGGFGHTGGGVQ